MPRLSERSCNSLDNPAGLHTPKDKQTHTPRRLLCKTSSSPQLQHLQHSLSESWSTGPSFWSDWPNKSAHPALSPANPNKQAESAKRLSENQQFVCLSGLSLEGEQVKGNFVSWVCKVQETLLFLPWVSIKKKRHLLTESSLHSLFSPDSSCSSVTAQTSDVCPLQRFTSRCCWDVPTAAV